MSKVSFLTQLKELKTVLPGMSPTDRVKHLWTYYKWLIPVVLALVVLVSIILTGITNRNKVVSIGGVAVNVPFSEAGEQYLHEDYMAHEDMNPKKYSVMFSETYIRTMENATNFQDNYYSLMGLLALCSSKQVDYLIVDVEGGSVLVKQDAFLDLRLIYTQEELDAFGDKVIWMENSEMGEATPIMLDITDMPFIQDNATIKDKVLFGFVSNSPRIDQAKEMLEYMQAWKSQAA